jgi:formate/nitrite transporter
MDWIKPSEVAETFLASGVTKAHLPALQLLVRGFLSGALLGFATSVAFTANAQGLPPIVGAVLFPCGFAMIVILGLELVTGSFAMLPAALFSRRIGIGPLLGNLTLVFIGNLIGGLVYGAMYAAVQTQLHHAPATGPAALIVAAAQAKTLGYQKLGAAGMGLSVVKAMLCNWMVCMGVVMGLTSRSTLGKIAACWLPIFIFFALGYEHSVVNMFIIPSGMMMGAHVSIRDWWLWNQIPVTAGNLIGALVFVALPMLWMRTASTTQSAEIVPIDATPIEAKTDAVNA